MLVAAPEKLELVVAVANVYLKRSALPARKKSGTRPGAPRPTPATAEPAAEKRPAAGPAWLGPLARPYSWLLSAWLRGAVQRWLPVFVLTPN